MLAKTILVTGAASGIGAATCQRMTHHGYRVIGVDLDAAGLEKLAAAGHCDETVVLDLTDAAAIRSALDGLRLDAVANVAGVGPDAGDVAKIFRINLIAPLLLLECVRDGLGPQAAVVNVSSITGELADAAMDSYLGDPLAGDFIDRITRVIAEPTAAYTYSKRALIAESMRLAAVWAPAVRVNCLSPGIIDTPMGDRSMAFTWTQKASERIPLGRLGAPDEIADVIDFLLDPRSSYVVGASLVVDGGYAASQRARQAARARDGA
jgi:NAD(P)-dependent dehydrogenase (short-subunit alcohol dehydrogenase family)